MRIIINISLLLLLLVVSSLSPLQAQEPLAMSVSGMFDQLYANDRAAKKVNDSLFFAMEKEPWIANFVRRGQRNGGYYQQNESILRRLRQLFSQPTMSDGNIRDIFDRIRRYAQEEVTTDPYLAEELNQAISQFVNDMDMSKPQSRQMKVEQLRMLAGSRYQIFLYGDTLALRQSLKLYRRLADDYNDTLAIQSMLHTPEYVTLSLLSLEELHSYQERYLEQLGADPSVAEGIRMEQEFFLYCHVYTTDYTRYKSQIETTSAGMLTYLKQHPVSLIPQHEPHLRNLQSLRLDRGELTRQALIDSLCLYRKVFYPGTIQADQVTAYLDNVMKCVQVIDGMQIAESAKHDSVLRYSNLVNRTLREMKGSLYSPQLLNALSVFARQPMVHAHLTTPERRQYLESLLFYTQPFTQAHSATVSALSQIILRGALQYRPELVIGVLGTQSVAEVERRKEEILTYFADGTRYHDIGKTSMPYIIRRDSRALTDREYRQIKRHPELGLSYLKVDSALWKLHDIVLGHHKWYNGKGGYPTWFDNTKSPDRTLIDILTLADCLEAATSRVGRNYRKKKRYNDLLQEFQTGAGSRYNPDLVQLLVEHPEVGQELDRMCEESWKEIYYGTFAELIK